MPPMDFDSLIGGGRAGRLRAIINRENCGRFSDDLGDNNLTFAVAVIHNLRHLLEEALQDEPGITINRPRNSFQIEIDRRLTVHFYKARTGPADVGEIRFDESKKKLQLIADNSAQLALFSDNADALGAVEPRHLVVVHAGTPTLGLVGASIGAPHFSPVAGPTWLWREQLDDGSPLSSEPASTAPAWADDSALPELIIELKPGAAERRADEAS
jgi:hypothetical protein